MLKTFSGRLASQNEYELRGLIDLFQREGVTRYCEIGSREGDTFVEVMESLPAGSHGVAVDLPGGLWGKSSTRSKLPRAIDHLKRKGYKVSCLFGDSHSDAMRKLVKGRGPYDAILIDGDHTLAGVTRDFDHYGSMAPLVAFHDIVGTGQCEKVTNREVEVPIFWESVKRKYKHREFVDEGSKMGIGVLWT
jgi:hypothetical protein